jgi:hypothetical protein
MASRTPVWQHGTHCGRVALRCVGWLLLILLGRSLRVHVMVQSLGAHVMVQSLGVHVMVQRSRGVLEEMLALILAKTPAAPRFAVSDARHCPAVA